MNPSGGPQERLSWFHRRLERRWVFYKIYRVNGVFLKKGRGSRAKMPSRQPVCGGVIKMSQRRFVGGGRRGIFLSPFTLWPLAFTSGTDFKIRQEQRQSWPALRLMEGPMKATSPQRKFERPALKPISLGLNCWLWERGRIRRMMLSLGKQLGVHLQFSQRVYGLRCNLRCLVTGQNVDRFIGEFARHC